MPEVAKRPWRTGQRFRPVTVTKADGTVEVRKKARKPKPYSKSKVWRKKRLAVLKRDDFRCSRCKRAKGDADPRVKAGVVKVLEVHHLTYKNYGSEPLGDLITLCQKCHTVEHQWRKRRNYL